MASTGQPSADWLGPAELTLPPGLVLSFQRYALPDSGVIEAAPASLGALPVGLSRDGELLLPLAPRECFWIGMRADTAHPLELAAAMESDDGPIDVMTGKAWNASTAVRARVPGTPVIDGIRRADGAFDPLLREDGAALRPRGRRLQLWVGKLGERAAAPVLIELVDYAAFSARTGLPVPEPLDPDAGYKGWLLP